MVGIYVILFGASTALLGQFLENDAGSVGNSILIQPQNFKFPHNYRDTPPSSSPSSGEEFVCGSPAPNLWTAN